MIENQNTIASLEQKIEYQFKNLALLQQALTHPSLKQHDRDTQDYERLELLGDAILGFIVTEMVYNHYHHYTEGQLAKIKAYVVSKDIVVKIANQLGIAQYIIMTHGEEKSGGRLNSNNMENAMEALIAAIYLDSDIQQTKIIVARLWSDHIENTDLQLIDPKSTLQELVQKQSKTNPVYKVINTTGLAHSPVFTVQVSTDNHIATATGLSIKEAEKKAASQLIKKIKQNNE